MTYSTDTFIVFAILSPRCTTQTWQHQVISHHLALVSSSKSLHGNLSLHLCFANIPPQRKKKVCPSLWTLLHHQTEPAPCSLEGCCALESLWNKPGFRYRRIPLCPICTEDEERGWGGWQRVVVFILEGRLRRS